MSFDNIYHDFEAAPERRGSSKGSEGTPKQRGSSIFRKSFSSGNNSNGSSGDSPKSPTAASSSSSSSNYLSNPAYEESDFNFNNVPETPSPRERRPSTGGKLLKVFSFSPKAGGTPSTEDSSISNDDATAAAARRVSFSPGSAAAVGEEEKQPKRKSSNIFRKFSFTS